MCIYMWGGRSGSIAMFVYTRGSRSNRLQPSVPLVLMLLSSSIFPIVLLTKYAVEVLHPLCWDWVEGTGFPLSSLLWCKLCVQWLVGTEFASQYWLQPSGFLKVQCIGVRPLHPLLSHLLLTGLQLTTNLLS